VNEREHTTVHHRDLSVSSSNDRMNDQMDGLHDGRLASPPVNDRRGQDEGVDRGGLRHDLDEGPSGPDDLMDSAPTMVLSVRGGVMPSARARIQDDWSPEDFGTGERQPDASVGLASLGFIRAALRRRARVWCVIALVGLLAGGAYLKERPLAQTAIVTLLLASPPDSTAGQAIADDQAYIQSIPIAAQALRQLKLHEPVTVFIRHYSVTVVTNSVLTITAKAPSSAEAVGEANALAEAFLLFQKKLLTSQTQLVNAQYNAAISQASQSVKSLNTVIKDLSEQHASPTVNAQLNNLKAERTRADSQLTITTQTLLGDEATNAAANASVIVGSKVLTQAVPVPASGKKALAMYVGGGLIAGLVLGMGIVVIGALVSDRLRRRDDVARILGTPVRLSVGKIPVSRWQSGRRGLGLADNRHVQQIVEYLHDVARHSPGNPASLALIPVDDVQIPAACLAALALSCAHLGLHVVLADLCPGTPAARLLHVTEPGVVSVNTQGVDIAVVVPDADSVYPVGPLLKSRRARAPKPLIAACRSADMLLTLAPLDPAFGGEHLSGWATSLVAMVTAGRSSAERIAAVGEMIRQTGIEATAGVLLDADKGDESLGVLHEQPTGRDAGLAGTGRSAASGLFSSDR
jgi:capsular polysaccharide biosynthesis protein